MSCSDPLQLDAPLKFRAAWLLLLTIPVGVTVTYKALGEALGGVHPRAIAAAMKANPCAPIVPCHRVVPSSGGLGGYSAGGPAVKRRLLEVEGALEDGKPRRLVRRGDELWKMLLEDGSEVNVEEHL